MAISVVGDTAGPSAGTTSAEALLAPVTGNWLVAIVAWAAATDPTVPVFSVGDSARNMWSLAYSTTTTASAANASAKIYVQVWVCPNVTLAGWTSFPVYVSFINVWNSDTGSPAIEILEVSGMGNGFLTVDSVTLNTGTGTSFSLTVPTPAANCLMIASAAVNNNTIPGSTSWTLTTGTATSTPNVGVRSVWIESATTQTATFTLAGSQSWVGVAVAIRQTGTVVTQPNPNAPALDFQLGLGYTLQTPLTAVTWTSLPNRLYSESQTWVSTLRGIQYELGLVQSQPTTLTLRNDDGTFTPRSPATTSATANGTTTTILVNSSATITVSDFFQLKTAGGALKEYTVFQVAALSTSGGTTTVTFKRADGTGSGALVATATGDQFVGAPIDVYNPYRVVATWSGKQYVLAAGWIERWPQTWSDPHWGFINAIGIDALATLTAADQAPLKGEILARNPQSYWPLNDQTGATTAQNASFSGTATLTQTTSSHGAGTNGQGSFGTSTQNVATGFGAGSMSPPTMTLAGDPGTAWSGSGQTSAELAAGNGFALVGDDVNFPAISAGVTIVGNYFQTYSQVQTLDAMTPAGAQTLFVIRQTASTNTVFKLALISGGTGPDPQITWWDQATGTPTSVRLTTVYNYGTTGWWFGLTLTQSQWTFHSQSSTAPNFQAWEINTSGACNIKPTFGHICIGGEADAVTNGFCLPGSYSHFAIFPRLLSNSEMLAMTQASNIGDFQSPVGSNDNINRKLWYVGWKGARALQWTNIYAGSDRQASTIAEKIANLSDQEGGRLFCDANGQLQTRTRYRFSLQTTRATLGDRPDLGEVPFLGDSNDLALDYDPTYVYNQVAVANTQLYGGWNPLTTTTYTVQNASSIGKYGLRTLGKTTSLKNGSDAAGLASYLLTQYQTPQLRVQAITIDAIKYSAALAFCLSVEVGDLLTVNRRPIGAPMLSFNVIVLQVQHDVGKDYWNTKLTLGAAPR